MHMPLFGAQPVNVINCCYLLSIAKLQETESPAAQNQSGISQ